jgi:ubiquitin C-terminal hydrolase
MNNTSSRIIPKIGIVGFTNIGNTCYMNSILQLLIHCNSVVSFFIIKDSFTEYKTYVEEAAMSRIAEKERKKQKLEEDAEITIQRSDYEKFLSTTISERLSDIISLMIDKGNSKITPTNFKKIIDYKLPAFRGSIQHDAHELFLQILDNIIEETGVESEPVINNVPDIIKEFIELKQQCRNELIQCTNPEEKIIILNKLKNFKITNNHIINKYDCLTYMVKEFKSRYNPLIYKIKTFTITTITCTTCNNINSKCEVTTIIQLPITSSIYESFEKFCSQELTENYNCSVCSCKRTVQLITKIFRPPLVLFIHLKRFKNLSTGRLLKDNRNIDIPFELDLNPFCDSSMLTDDKLSNVYKLKGISNHHGSLHGGHYTADCAGLTDPENWYHFDDSNVSVWDGNKIDTSSAYILMYEMQI